MKERTYRAAGGVVLDEKGRVLLMDRYVIRDGAVVYEIRLPKGHVEEGETDQEAALREVCEETGYCNLHVVADLGEAVSEWDGEDEHVRRTEHYYLMRLADPRRNEPHPNSNNPDEARFRLLWVADLAQAEMLLTFPSEREFARRAVRFADSLIR